MSSDTVQDLRYEQSRATIMDAYVSSGYRARAVNVLLDFHEKAQRVESVGRDVTPLLFRLVHPPELDSKALLSLNNAVEHVVAYERQARGEV